jgi:hypothetical protein
VYLCNFIQLSKLDQIGFRVTRSLQVLGRFPSKDSLDTVNKTKKLKKISFTTDLLVKGRKLNTCEGNLFLFFETNFSPEEYKIFHQCT